MADQSLAHRLKPESRSEEQAERAGYLARKDGPNQINCHFSFFATPELSKAWERGNVRGKKQTT